MNSLSLELYSKSTHFVFEFIQNADDNIYEETVAPSFEITVEDRKMSFHSNEIGFNAQNVKAICKVGASTKKNLQGYIGM